jgi:hypothetical protein
MEDPAIAVAAKSSQDQQPPGPAFNSGAGYNELRTANADLTG